MSAVGLGFVMIMLVEGLLTIAAGYLAVGIIVGLLFVTVFVSRLDTAAVGSSIFFRITILLGCILLWPYIVLRTLSGRKINQPTGDPSIADHE